MTAPDDDRIIAIALEFLRGISFRNDTPDYLTRQRALSKSPASMVSSAGSSASHFLDRRVGTAWPVDTYYSGSLDGFTPESHSRVLLTTRNGSPMRFCSFLALEIVENAQKPLGWSLVDTSFLCDGELGFGSGYQKRNAPIQSFAHLLTSSSSSDSSDSSSSSSSESSDDSSASWALFSPPHRYDPEYLDDPSLKTGKHKTVLNLPSFLGSITHYTSHAELKRELNEQFRQRHPHIHPSITLSQIRNLKQRLLDTALRLNVELSTVAKSYAYFEKLLLAGKVIKGNRKVVGACCLLLALKTNDSRTTPVARCLLEVCRCLRICGSHHQVTRAEFAVFAGLRFDLLLPEPEYMPHFERIFNSLEFATFQEYMGERMYHQWSRQVQYYERGRAEKDLEEALDVETAEFN